MTDSAHDVLTRGPGGVVVRVVDAATPCVRNALACHVAELELASPEGAAGPCAELTPDPAASVLLATIDDHPVGLGVVAVGEGGAASITHLWVRPAWRRHGWGAHLLGALEHAAADRGAREVRAHAHPALPAACRLLARAGYSVAGVDPTLGGAFTYGRELTSTD